MNRCLLSISKRAILQYIYILLFMIIHGNRILTIYNDYILVFILGLGFFTIIKNPAFVEKCHINFLILLLCLLISTSFFTFGSLMPTTILALLSRFIIAFLAVDIDKKHFVDRFIKFVYFIACISLIGFLITQLSPELLIKIFPKYTYYYVSPWSGQAIARPTYYAILFQFRGDHDISRNIGMFNEPGLYQIVLNTALFFLLFAKTKCFLNNKKRKKYIIIIALTLLTTQSVTAYIGLLIIIAGYSLAEKKVSRWKAMLVLLALIIGAGFYFVFNGTESWLYQKVLRKLITEDGTLNLMGSTGKSRIVSMMADIKIFIQNPFGNGTKHYQAVWSSLLTEKITDTSSPVGMTSSLAIYGIFSVGLIWWFYIKNNWKNKSNHIDWFVCIALIVNTTLAQPSIFFPCFIAMSLINRNEINITNERGYLNE